MIKWIPIDIENLPKEEVLAIDNTKDCLVGYLFYTYSRNMVICDDDRTQLHGVTHYILIKDLSNLLDEQ